MPLENSDSQRDCCAAIKSSEFKPGQSELMARNKVSNTCLTLHMTRQLMQFRQHNTQLISDAKTDDEESAYLKGYE